MTALAKSWLPREAFSDGALSLVISEIAVAWSRKWLGAGDDVRARIHEAAGDARIPLAAACWETACEQIAVVADRAVWLRLAASMLGLKQVGARPTAADLRLLRQMADACFSDFVRELAGVFHTSSQVEDAPERLCDLSAHPGVWCKVHLGTIDCAFEVFIDQAAAADARKARIAGASASELPLGRRDDAIDKQMVRVGVRVGEGNVSLSELSSLACGDVLVLDSGIDEALKLTINGELAHGVDCELQREGASFHVRLVESESGAIQ